MTAEEIINLVRDMHADAVSNDLRERGREDGGNHLVLQLIAGEMRAYWTILRYIDPSVDAIPPQERVSGVTA